MKDKFKFELNRNNFVKKDIYHNWIYLIGEDEIKISEKDSDYGEETYYEIFLNRKHLFSCWRYDCSVEEIDDVLIGIISGNYGDIAYF